MHLRPPYLLRICVTTSSTTLLFVAFAQLQPVRRYAIQSYYTRVVTILKRFQWKMRLSHRCLIFSLDSTYNKCLFETFLSSTNDCLSSTNDCVWRPRTTVKFTVVRGRQKQSFVDDKNVSNGHLLYVESSEKRRQRWESLIFQENVF